MKLSLSPFFIRFFWFVSACRHSYPLLASLWRPSRCTFLSLLLLVFFTILSVVCIVENMSTLKGQDTTVTWVSRWQFSPYTSKSALPSSSRSWWRIVIRQLENNAARRSNDVFILAGLADEKTEESAPLANSLVALQLGLQQYSRPSVIDGTTVYVITSNGMCSHAVFVCRRYYVLCSQFFPSFLNSSTFSIRTELRSHFPAKRMERFRTRSDCDSVRRHKIKEQQIDDNNNKKKKKERKGIASRDKHGKG